MSLEVQIQSFIYSFVFGFFFNFIFNLSYKYLFSSGKIIKVLLNVLFVIASSLLYFVFLMIVNSGVLHIYFLLFVVMGFIFGNYYFKRNRRY